MSSSFSPGSSTLPRSSACPDGYLADVSKLLPALDRPSIIALDFRVESLTTAEQALRGRAVQFTKNAGQLLVDPEQGFGAGVLFTEAREAIN